MSKLIVTIGVSASGKTTWSKDHVKLYPHIIRLSTDECRHVLTGDEGNQECSHKVFESIYLITEHLLNQGKDVLIDSTAYSIKNRKRFIEIAKRTNSEVEAHVFGQSLKFVEILDRNNNRDRKVPENVIIRQLSNFEMPTTDEGFDLIVINNYVDNS